VDPGTVHDDGLDPLAAEVLDNQGSDGR